MFVGSVVFASALADMGENKVEPDGAFRAWGAGAPTQKARRWGPLVFAQYDNVSSGGAPAQVDSGISERAGLVIQHQSIQP